MSFDTAKGNLNQVEGKIKQKWGKLTHDDFTSIKGSAQNLAGKLQERYGMLKDEAEQQANDFFKSINENTHQKSDSAHEQLTKTTETVEENINNVSAKLIVYVKSKPLLSLVLAFVAGIVVALIVRS